MPAFLPDLNTDTQMLAAQICLMDHAQFCKIGQSELLCKNWTRPNRDRKAPNVVAMINNFNRLSLWQASQVVGQPNPEQRAQVIEQAIAIAEHLLLLQNFSGIRALLSGLQHSGVQRLKQSWACVSRRSMQVYENLQKIFDPQKNSATYRSHLSAAIPPAIPFIGVHLTDLVFVEDGNSEFLADQPSLINFSKKATTAGVLDELLRFQSAKFDLVEAPLVQRYFKTVAICEDDEIYSNSYIIEPRENAGIRIRP